MWPGIEPTTSRTRGGCSTTTPLFWSCHQIYFLSGAPGPIIVTKIIPTDLVIMSLVLNWLSCHWSNAYGARTRNVIYKSATTGSCFTRLMPSSFLHLSWGKNQAVSALLALMRFWRNIELPLQNRSFSIYPNSHTNSCYIHNFSCIIISYVKSQTKHWS